MRERVEEIFQTDVFSRMIVGWRVAQNMRTEMVLDSLEMARWSRGTRLEGLVCHSDAGSQYTSIRYTERLNENSATPSSGSIADSYDTAPGDIPPAEFEQAHYAQAGSVS